MFIVVIIILLLLLFLSIQLTQPREYFEGICNEKPKPFTNKQRRYGDILVYENSESISM